MVKCCIINCPSRKDSSIEKSLHRFPTDRPSLNKRWIEATGVAADENIKNKRVCSLHFGKDDFEQSTGRPNLKSTASPSLELSSREKYEVELESLQLQDIQSAVINVRPDITLVVKVKNQEPVVSGKKYLAVKLDCAQVDTVLKTDETTITGRLNACRRKNSVLRRRNKDLESKIKNFREKLGETNLTLKSVRSNKREACERLERKINSMHKAHSYKNAKLENALKSIFTEKQIKVLVNNQQHGKWTNEDIGKAITLKYKNNVYEHLRTVGFPFPSTRTLQRWMHQIIMEPGILYCVLNLLKNEFEQLNEFDRTSVISFDELSIDSSIVYDPIEDKIYGPKNNLNAWFVRGLFRPWKQLIAYDFDEKLTPEKFLKLVTDLEECGLRVRACANDLGGKNRGLWRKLGVKCEVSQPDEGTLLKVKSFCLNPVSQNKIWFFADAPHLLKLLRNNLLTHGFTLEGGYQLVKADFEQLVSLDHAELRANFPLQKEHLNLTGKDKQTVSYAVHFFSRKTAHAWNVAFPNRQKEGNFLLLVADWFDVFNSRYSSETMPSKKPFGLDIDKQMEVLSNMRKEILGLRVGNSKGLYPFQRGILNSIQSLEGLYQDVSGSLNAKYVLTSRLTQDFVENSFSILRGIGRFNDHPTAVDAKHRLKILMLQWGGKLSAASPVASEDDESQPFVSARMMSSLLDASPVNLEDNWTPVVIPEEIPVANELDEDIFVEVLDSMGTEQRFEEYGKEYICGYVASKLKISEPQLTATEHEVDIMEDHSWVNRITLGGLTIPSLEWRNKAAILEEEFRAFHRYSRNKVNESVGVLKGFVLSLQLKYPEIPSKAVHLYIKSRLFIRIKAVNKMLKEEAEKKRQKRRDIIYQATLRKRNQQLDPQEFDSDYENSEDEFEEDEDDVDDHIEDDIGNRSFSEYLNTEGGVE